MKSCRFLPSSHYSMRLSETPLMLVHKIHEICSPFDRREPRQRAIKRLPSQIIEEKLPKLHKMIYGHGKLAVLAIAFDFLGKNGSSFLSSFFGRKKIIRFSCLCLVFFFAPYFYFGSVSRSCHKTPARIIINATMEGRKQKKDIYYRSKKLRETKIDGFVTEVDDNDTFEHRPAEQI